MKNFFLLVLLFVCLLSCSKDIDPSDKNEIDEPEYGYLFLKDSTHTQFELHDIENSVAAFIVSYKGNIDPNELSYKVNVEIETDDENRNKALNLITSEIDLAIKSGEDEFLLSPIIVKLEEIIELYKSESIEIAVGDSLSVSLELSTEAGKVINRDNFTMPEIENAPVPFFGFGAYVRSGLAGKFKVYHVRTKCDEDWSEEKWIENPGEGFSFIAEWIEVGPYLFEVQNDFTYQGYALCYWHYYVHNGPKIEIKNNKIYPVGKDSYGEEYEFPDVSVDGDKLSLSILNTAGEYTEIVLQREDGLHWPQLGPI